jgi:hypothetical protein
VTLTDHGPLIVQSATPACTVCQGEGMVLTNPPGPLGMLVDPRPVACPHCVGWTTWGHLPVLAVGAR